MVSRPPPPSRAAFRVWRTFATRWRDNDAYGHVNNSVYYEWFDSAVNAWLVERGLLDIAAGDPIAVVVETRCIYAAPLAFPEPVEVGLVVAELGRSSVRYRLGVFAKGADRAAASGEFVHVLVDRATRTPVDVPAAWRSAFEVIRIS
ncbi:MAG: thioesterase family protein [Sphingomicrobium sp.]